MKKLNIIFDVFGHRFPDGWGMLRYPATVVSLRPLQINFAGIVIQGEDLKHIKRITVVGFENKLK